MNEYAEFLKGKERKTRDAGFDVPESAISDKLYDFQVAIVRWAIRKGRAAIFADCGLGKTPMQLEWARLVCERTDRDVLILAPLAVSLQTKYEGEKFDIHVNVCKSQADVIPGINITNYERLDKFDPSAFIGVVLDESSILKSFMGKTKQQIINSFRDTQYKLCCTATPSPNDHMEILNHSDFFRIMKANEALGIWFINDTMNMGTYRLKKHAVKDFWRWVSTWAVSLAQPSDLGFDDAGFVLPPLHVERHILPIDLSINATDGMLFRIPEMNATSFHKEKRLSAIQRAERAGGLINGDSPYMVWCDTNYEADALRDVLPDAIEVRGSDKPEKKEETALAFAAGEIPVLISKPSIFGFGMNFQACHNVIFAGLSYSYESYYQATRRFWRFVR